MTIKIITKTGDDGETSLLMGGRVPKNDCRVIANGRIDTLHASLGLVHQQLDKQQCSDQNISEILFKIQKSLIKIMGEIATADDEKVKYQEKFDCLEDNDLDFVEKSAELLTNDLEKENYEIKGWILYGSSNAAAAHLDYSSKLCREAEILVVDLKSSGHEVRNTLTQYLNRLSDVLFIMARYKEVF